MLNFIQEPEFSADLDRIEPNEEYVDDLTRLIEDAVNDDENREVYSAVQVKYNGKAVSAHFCKTGCLVTMLFARDKRYDEDEMRPLAPPHVPGNTEAERMDNAVRKMFSVSKKDIVKAEAKWKRQRQRSKKSK